jgi:hypothetical protein
LKAKEKVTYHIQETLQKIISAFFSIHLAGQERMGFTVLKKQTNKQKTANQEYYS